LLLQFYILYVAKQRHYGNYEPINSITLIIFIIISSDIEKIMREDLVQGLVDELCARWSQSNYSFAIDPSCFAFKTCRSVSLPTYASLTLVCVRECVCTILETGTKLMISQGKPYLAGAEESLIFPVSPFPEEALFANQDLQFALFREWKRAEEARCGRLMGQSAPSRTPDSEVAAAAKDGPPSPCAYPPGGHPRSAVLSSRGPRLRGPL